LNNLTGGLIAAPGAKLELPNLTPRLWYLSPSADGGILIP
jgi:hypothetical protein